MSNPNTMYSGMTFPDYDYREYPKFMATGEKRDPATGHTYPTGELVHSAEEEAAFFAKRAPPPQTKTETPEPPKAPHPLAAEPASTIDPDAELKALQKRYAEATGKEPDKRWGLAKLNTVLSNADHVDNDQDPDA